MPQFTVAELRPDQLDDAYPLIRAVAPNATPAEWRAYIEDMTARGGTVLALTSGNETLHGLLTVHRQRSLRHGEILFVNNFVTFELSRSAPGRRALCAAVEDMARRTGAGAIHLLVANRGQAEVTPVSRAWAELGYGLEGALLCKPVTAHGSAERGGLQAAVER